MGICVSRCCTCCPLCDCPPCEVPTPISNVLIAILTGLLFWTAWWIMIDIWVFYPNWKMAPYTYYCLPIILGSLGFFFLALSPNGLISGRKPYAPPEAVCCARFFAFLGFVMLFTEVISVLVILIYECITVEAEEVKEWPKWGALLANIFMVTAVLMFKFCIVTDEECCP